MWWNSPLYPVSAVVKGERVDFFRYLPDIPSLGHILKMGGAVWGGEEGGEGRGRREGTCSSLQEKLHGTLMYMSEASRDYKVGGGSKCLP